MSMEIQNMAFTLTQQVLLGMELSLKLLILYPICYLSKVKIDTIFFKISQKLGYVVGGKAVSLINIIIPDLTVSPLLYLLSVYSTF